MGNMSNHLIMPTATCHAMNEVYDMLKKLSIEELERCINEAPLAFIRGWTNQEGGAVTGTYADVYAMECLYVYQCKETISRKKAGIW